MEAMNSLHFLLPSFILVPMSLLLSPRRHLPIRLLLDEELPKRGGLALLRRVPELPVQGLALLRVALEGLPQGLQADGALELAIEELIQNLGLARLQLLLALGNGSAPRWARRWWPATPSAGPRARNGVRTPDYLPYIILISYFTLLLLPASLLFIWFSLFVIIGLWWSQHDR